MNKRVLRWVIFIVIGVLAALLIVVQIWNQVSSGVRSETATHATVTDSLQTEGRIIRKEILIENTTGGVVSYEVEDGNKVSGGGVIASVYGDADAAVAESKRIELQTQLTKLQTLEESAGKTTISPDVVNKQIYQRLYQLQLDNSDYNLLAIEEDRSELLNLLNQWQLATGKASSYAGRIAEIQNEMNSLQTGEAFGTITAPASGFFVQTTDGYETVYDYDTVTSLTVADLQQTPQPNPVSDSVIGKICTQFNWYVACVIPSETASNLMVGDQITIRLPFVTNEELPATVVALNQTDPNADAALVLQCSYMNSTLANIRDETVIVNVNTYSGIRVSQSAVHFQTVETEVQNEDGTVTKVQKEIRGVYVASGSFWKFVQIFPLYANSSYVICDPDPDSEDLYTSTTVQLYDTVAIGGEDLYDGKPIT